MDWGSLGFALGFVWGVWWVWYGGMVCLGGIWGSGLGGNKPAWLHGMVWYGMARAYLRCISAVSLLCLCCAVSCVLCRESALLSVECRVYSVECGDGVCVCVCVCVCV